MFSKFYVKYEESYCDGNTGRGQHEHADEDAFGRAIYSCHCFISGRLVSMPKDFIYVVKCVRILIEHAYDDLFYSN